MPRNDQDEERQRLFARNLRAARERAGLTQASIATKLGMEDEVYARYERAKMWPSLERLGRICDILECTSDSLLGTGQPPSQPALPPAPVPDDDSGEVRRLLRRLRKARPRTVRAVQRMLAALESPTRAMPEGAQAGSLAGNDDDAAAGDAFDEDVTTPAAGAPGGDATTPPGAAPADDGSTHASPGKDGDTGEP